MFKKLYTRCTSDARLDNKVAIVTGANSGIGKETAKDLYGRGARVIMACRNMEKAELAKKDIENNPFSSTDSNQHRGNVGELAICYLDLCKLKSIRECAKYLLTTESAIHLLINNAGVMMSPYEKTEDGFELQLQSNYLGHFLLTLLLLPRIQSSAPGCRIINVASLAYILGSINLADMNLESSYNITRPLKAYSQSKLANILFTKELARRLKLAEISGINVYALHPGVINTELGRHFHKTVIPGGTFFFERIMGPFIKNQKEGAQTTIYCAVDDKVADETGLYYKECSVTNPLPKARNAEMAKNLWDHTCRLLKLESDENFATFLINVSRQSTE